MRLILSFVSLLLFATSAMALTLDEAVDLAVNNDYSIKQNRAQLDAQRHTTKSAIAGFLPYVDAKYTHTDTRTQDSSYPNATNEQSSLGLEIGINVFNGFADVNTYRMSGVAYDMQNNLYAGSKQDIMLSTKLAYISYLKAMNTLNIAKQSLELLEAQKKIAEVSYNVGQFSRSDVLRVDVQLASTQLDLLNAEINVKLTRQQLEKYIGRVITETEVVSDIKLSDTYVIPTLDSLYTKLEDRSELQYARGAQSVSKYTVEKSKSNFMPKAYLSYTHNWYGDRYDPFGGRDGGPTAYDESGTVAIAATWNLFKGTYDYHTYLANKITVDARSFAVSDLRSKLRLQLRSNYENYFSAQERLAVAKVAVDQAEESYRVTKSQYMNSEATTTDLLNANVMLNSAQNSYVAANYDIVAAIAQIERAVEQQLLGIKSTN